MDYEKAHEDLFWSGFYASAWEPKTTPERTAVEIKGVLDLLNPKPGSHILDWCGGMGRHSIELAKLGFKVTLLDYTKLHLDKARSDAASVGVDLNIVKADFRNTPSGIQADYAVNLFTAGLGYISPEADLKALKSLNKALKPGARILIDTGSMFWIVRNYIPNTWSTFGDTLVLHSRKIDYLDNRTVETLLVKKANGTEEIYTVTVQVFTPGELNVLLKRAGFKVEQLYGDFDGSEFTFRSRRIIMIASKK